MADIIFNIAKGRLAAYVDRVVANDPANSAITVVILKTAAADAVLQDLDTLAAILAGASVEADFTNYARKQLTDAVEREQYERAAQLRDEMRRVASIEGGCDEPGEAS